MAGNTGSRAPHAPRNDYTPTAEGGLTEAERLYWYNQSRQQDPAAYDGVSRTADAADFRANPLWNYIGPQGPKAGNPSQSITSPQQQQAILNSAWQTQMAAMYGTPWQQQTAPIGNVLLQSRYKPPNTKPSSTRTPMRAPQVAPMEPQFMNPTSSAESVLANAARHQQLMAQAPNQYAVDQLSQMYTPGSHWRADPSHPNWTRPPRQITGPSNYGNQHVMVQPQPQAPATYRPPQQVQRPTVARPFGGQEPGKNVRR